MSCQKVPFEGGYMVLCSRGQRTPKCCAPGCDRPASKLCDYPVTRKGRSGTCSAKICDQHRAQIGEDEDYCLPHAKAVGVIPVLTP